VLLLAQLLELILVPVAETLLLARLVPSASRGSLLRLLDLLHFLKLLH